MATLLAGARFHPERPAAWVRDVQAGEKVEFLTAHGGTARRSGVPAPSADQPGISVLPLPGLELLGDHTQVIHLPESDREAELRVRVPSLGAYIINKASTFLNRGGRRDEDGHLKYLLYIRDLMAAPAVVIDHIEADMERIAGSAEQYAEMVRTGANHLGLVLRDGSHPLLEAVARMLIERDPKVPREDARARTLGYLTDLHEILAGVSERYTRD